MQRGQGIGDPVLRKVVADRHLSAETVAAKSDRHIRRHIRRRLDQHRNAQPRQTECVSNRALVPEVRQGDNNSVDTILILAEQLGAPHRVFIRLDGSVFALIGPRTRSSIPAFCTAFIISSARLCQVPGKKPRLPMIRPIVIS